MKASRALKQRKGKIHRLLDTCVSVLAQRLRMFKHENIFFDFRLRLYFKSNNVFFSSE